MQALHLVTTWPVEHVTAAVVTPTSVETIGDTERRYQLASVTKPVTALAIMIAVEERTLELDSPMRFAPVPSGVTLRHLLAHAAGYGFDGDAPLTGIERRRIYSNTGIELAAAELAGAASMPFDQYLREAVLEPLSMGATTLVGSPAHGLESTSGDVARFVAEMLRPQLICSATHHELTSIQFPSLAGIVPDVGRFDPCPWGLGVEIRGAKTPHWTGRANSPATYGHFGGSGTMMWIDPSIDTGLVALTDRAFGSWREQALVLWPQLSDAVVSERRVTS